MKARAKAAQSKTEREREVNALLKMDKSIYKNYLQFIYNSL